MSDSQDTWSDIQALRSKRSSLRDKLMRRKLERETVVADALGTADTVPVSTTTSSPGAAKTTRDDKDSPSHSSAEDSLQQTRSATSSPKICLESNNEKKKKVPTINTMDQLQTESLAEIEKQLLIVIDDVSINLPVDITVLHKELKKIMLKEVPMEAVENLLQKFAAQTLVSLTSDSDKHGHVRLCVDNVDHKKLSAVSAVLNSEPPSNKRKRERAPGDGDDTPPGKESKTTDSDKSDTTIESLLSMQSAKERETKKINEEIIQLLSQPTAKEQSIVEKFKSQGGTQVKEFCQFGTQDECRKMSSQRHCDKLHFKKIINKHTDESLGDCSFLNTCYHMDSCKYVHYEIDYPDTALTCKPGGVLPKKSAEGSTILYPPQWIQCDLRQFDMSVLGKFAVIMADPPWDIHMELPYGTMQDDEMRRLNVPTLQDDGFIFLWVTGRAMELGRECLSHWGYQRVDELIWVKANQLQRIIRTGRTGHWLNHGKEHCLVGAKGNPKGINRGLDCDVIVAEVRATSHKPDEIYGIIERLSPGTRKIELFGRPHNVQPNWITLGNQVDGVKLIDPDVVRQFRKKYPDGNCMKPPER